MGFIGSTLGIRRVSLSATSVRVRGRPAIDGSSVVSPLRLRSGLRVEARLIAPGRFVVRTEKFGPRCRMIWPFSISGSCCMRRTVVGCMVVFCVSAVLLIEVPVGGGVEGVLRTERDTFMSGGVSRGCCVFCGSCAGILDDFILRFACRDDVWDIVAMLADVGGFFPV